MEGGGARGGLGIQRSEGEEEVEEEEEAEEAGEEGTLCRAALDRERERGGQTDGSVRHLGGYKRNWGVIAVRACGEAMSVSAGGRAICVDTRAVLSSGAK